MGSLGWATLGYTRAHSVVESDFDLITFDVMFGESYHGYTLAPLQRRYENLPPPIDVGEKIEAFRRARGERGFARILNAALGGLTLPRAA